MGCLSCLFCKKRIEPENIENTSLLKDEDKNEDKNEQKRKLAIYLVQKGLKKYHDFLPEIKNLNNEQFNNFFKGNTDYNNFKSSDPKHFNELVQEFGNHYDILSEFYDDEKYYPMIFELWKAKCFLNMKGKDDEEQKRILKHHGVKTEIWDEKFKNHVKSVTTESLSKEEIARILKNYIASDFGNFDEYVKTTTRCTKNIVENEKTYCGKILKTKLDENMEQAFKTLFPIFKERYINDNTLSSDFQKRQEKAAINKMIKSGMTEANSKRIIKEIIKKYEEEKFTGTFNPNEELKKVKDVSIKFSKGKLNELSFKEKADVFFSNEMIKHAVFGISLMNLTYGILHLGQRLFHYDEIKAELKIRLDDIKKSYQKHKDEVNSIPDDIDEAAEYIKKLNAKFNSDLEKVQELIQDIKDAINNEKTERNKSIFQFFGSIVFGGIGGAAAHLSKDMKDKIEYASSSLFNFINSGLNGVDIYKAVKNINELEKAEKEAIDLRKDIEKEIDKLKERFESLKTAHIPNFD